MRVIHSLLYAVAIVSLLLLGSCCCTGGLDDDEIDPGLPGVDNFVSTGDSDTGDYGGYAIDSGVTVTGVDSPSDLGISEGSTSGFVGDVYGATTFSPTSVTFSEPISMTMPTDADDGTYNVYRWNGSAWVLVGTATVSGGSATFTSSSFGSFIIGDMHDGGSGS